MTWETWFKITDILQDEAWHFALSAISGLLVFLLTLTTFGVVLLLASAMSASPVSATMAAKRFITGLALSFGLLAAWLLHIGLDWFVRLYNMPLGPHLPLVTR